MQYFITIIKKFTFLFLSFVLLFSSLNVAAEKQQISLSRIDSNITVDGVMDEAHWQNATRIPLIYQDEPNEKGTPPVKTDAFIYEDGTNLYVALCCTGPRP